MLVEVSQCKTVFAQNQVEVTNAFFSKIQCILNLKVKFVLYKSEWCTYAAAG